MSQLFLKLIYTEMFKFMRLLVDNRSSTMFSSGGPDYFLPDLKKIINAKIDISSK
jgi:hypothetical protein